MGHEKWIGIAKHLNDANRERFSDQNNKIKFDFFLKMNIIFREMDSSPRDQCINGFISQPAFTCSKSTMETPGLYVKSFQS